MFSKIRKRLTLYYSVLMTCFLLAFVGFIFIGVVWVVYSEEKQEVLLFAEEEAKEHSVLLRHQDILKQPQENEDYRDGSGRMFFYAFDDNSTFAEPKSLQIQGLVNTETIK